MFGPTGMYFAKHYAPGSFFIMQREMLPVGGVYLKKTKVKKGNILSENHPCTLKIVPFYSRVG